MSYFVHLCIEFQVNHGEALFCKKTYLDLKTGIQRLKELRVQWAFINFLEEGGDNVPAKHVVTLLHTDVQSVGKKKNFTDRFGNKHHSNKKDKKKRKRQRKQEKNSAAESSRNKSKSAKCK